MISIPFSGSKRYYVNQVEEIVKAAGYQAVYEPFGGSAVLSINLINDGVVENAYINDFDGLFDRYGEFLDIKDEVVKHCLDRGVEKTKGKKLPPDQQKILQDKILEIDKSWWPLLASNFVFSGRAQTKKDFNVGEFVYFQNDLTTIKQREFLEIVDQVERVSLDYRDFLKRYKDQLDEKSLIILDPPYLNSRQKQYNNDEFFGLAETIEMLGIIKETGCDFILFNMVEKDTRALLEAFGFEIVEMDVKTKQLNWSSKREDVMAYCRRRAQ